MTEKQGGKLSLLAVAEGGRRSDLVFSWVPGVFKVRVDVYVWVDSVSGRVK